MELFPGRALLLIIKRRNDKKLHILNIYPPTTQGLQQHFWSSATTRLRELNITTIDMLLGDFNLTEDPIDRAPARPADSLATEALKTFRDTYHLNDVWRHENPTTRLFTFTSNTQSMSRLDRIYTNDPLSRNIYDWDVTDTMIPSDHKMVLARIVPPHTPYIGDGRWTFPIFLMTDDALLKNIEKLGGAFQEQMNEPHEDNTIIQKRWLLLKSDITELAKKAGKSQLARITQKIRSLKKDIAELQQHPDLDTEQEQRTNLVILQHELQHLELKKGKTERIKAQAKWHDKGEKINKYWIRTHTPRRLRDIMHSLCNPSTNTLSSRSSKMAKIARDYHDNLQQENLLSPDNPNRMTAQHAVLTQIPEHQKFVDDSSELHTPITYQQVANALRASKNGSTTGLNGLPYELWKTLHERHLKLQKQRKPSFDVIECLTSVYQNIQRHGVDPTTNFSIGWMCPIYKKKDRTRIENYRPITLLNTDYKTMMKALASQLAKNICSLLHPD